MKNLVCVARQLALTELIQAVNQGEFADGEGALIMRDGNNWTLIKKGIRQESRNSPIPTMYLEGK